METRLQDQLDDPLPFTITGTPFSTILEYTILNMSFFPPFFFKRLIQYGSLKKKIHSFFVHSVHYLRGMSGVFLELMSAKELPM